MKTIKFNFSNSLQVVNPNKNRPIVTHNRCQFTLFQDSFSFSDSEKIQTIEPSPLIKQLQMFEFKIPDVVTKTIANAGKLFDYVAQKSKPAEDFVLETAKNSQILMLGENHAHIKSKNFAASLLPKLKSQGYNDVAIELHSSFQSCVDDFLAGKISEAELIKATTIKTKSSYENTLISGCSMPFINSCKKNGVNVHCIDTRGDQTFLDKVEELALQGDIEKMMELIASQDEGIFNNLSEKFLKLKPNAKVLIYVGNAHSRKRPVFDKIEAPSLRQYIDKTSTKTASIELASPEEANMFINTAQLKTNRGFSTQDKPISDLLHFGNLAEGGVIDDLREYGKNIDGMVILD